MNPDRIIALRATLTVFRDGDRCLKVFGEEYSQSSVLCEAFNAAYAAEAGVRTPRILEVTEVGGKRAIVSEYIKGKTLAALAAEQGDTGDCIARFAAAQAYVNSLAAPGLRSEKDIAAEGILRSGLPRDTVEALLAMNEAFPEGDRLLHGTPEMSNIIIDNTDNLYIIDWARASKGSPEADAARAYVLTSRLQGAGAAEEYLAQRCKAGDVSARGILKRLPVAAAAMLCLCGEHEREALKAFINTSEFGLRRKS